MARATGRARRSAWAAVATAVAVALAAGTGAAGTGAAGAVARSAPEGGPVDDGWLPGPAPGAAFSGFDAEPPPAGRIVWPGVRHDQRRTALGDGQPVDVHILHVDPGADVDVVPTLAGGTVHGVATVAAQSGDPLQGSVAAVNGGFWLSDPVGEPNGWFARDGRLVSDAETQGRGPRGAIGWTADGRVLVDRVDSRETVALPDGTTAVLDGVNRGHRDEGEQFFEGPDSLIAYGEDWGAPVSVRQPVRLSPPPEGMAAHPPADLAAVRLQVAGWPASGAATALVTAIDRDLEATYEVGPGEVLLRATGADAVALDPVAVGDVVVLATEIRPVDPARAGDWAAVVEGLAAGPHLVAGGRVVDPATWEEEGFSPSSHSNVRAPRTAAGVTADGRLLLVVADGRRPGVTVGFTMGELARYLLALGAVDATSLDGGASSQAVVDGILRNVPCCDAVTRPVATSLQIRHDEPFDDTTRLRGAGRVDTAVAVARHAFPDGAEVAVLASASTFPDALAGGPLAGAAGGPLLLSGRDEVPAQTLDALADLGVDRVAVLGGEGVLGPGVADDLARAGITATRVAGETRVDTAAAIAGALEREVGPGGVRRAFLAGADTFADALVAAGPGGLLGMPILLTPSDALHPSALAALRRLDDLDEVVVVGGEARVGPAVVRALRDEGWDVTRLAGDGRFGTARAVNAWLADQTALGDGLVAATGADFPDALAGGPLATALRAPLVILPPGSVDADPDAAAALEDLGDRGHVHVVGGLGAVSSSQQLELERLADGGAAVR
jgi:putative cell wall-binding protein